MLARAKKLVAAKHEARLNELLGPANRAALVEMLATIAREFSASFRGERLRAKPPSVDSRNAAKIPGSSLRRSLPE